MQEGRTGDGVLVVGFASKTVTKWLKSSLCANTLWLTRLCWLARGSLSSLTEQSLGSGHADQRQGTCFWGKKKKITSCGWEETQVKGARRQDGGQGPLQRCVGEQLN